MSHSCFRLWLHCIYIFSSCWLYKSSRSNCVDCVQLAHLHAHEECLDIHKSMFVCVFVWILNSIEKEKFRYQQIWTRKEESDRKKNNTSHTGLIPTINNNPFAFFLLRQSDSFFYLFIDVVFHYIHSTNTTADESERESFGML